MKNKLLLLIAFIQFGAVGQISDYNFKREISGITDDWHNVELPNEMYEKVNHSLNDIRFYGVTENGDTIEAPYLIRSKKDQITAEDIAFRVINSSRKNDGYYYTLQLDADEVINEISLDFSQNNFDWSIQLEGSQDQTEWFSIVDSYRILSISNERMNYAYERINFPDAKFKYYRIFIPSSTDPGFLSARVTHTTFISGKKREFAIKSQNIYEDKDHKETVIELTLETAVPVNSIKIEASNSFDYYRPVTISYIVDSTKTEKGYIRNYDDITRGTFSSMENNAFFCSNVTTDNFKIVISNHDNQPLNISKLSVDGYVYELVARFTEEADYSLVYGYSSAAQPNYDIDHFTSSIPEVLVPLTIGDEVSISKSETAIDTGSYFENPMRLWGIMGAIIILLGFFTFKMLGAEKGKEEKK